MLFTKDFTLYELVSFLSLKSITLVNKYQNILTNAIK